MVAQYFCSLDFVQARPEAATAAFWVSASLYLLVAVMLFFTTRRITENSGNKTGILVPIVVVCILLSLALADAAAAFQAHGPTLQIATTFMFVCMVAGFVATLLLITIVFLLRKRK